jgi:hypothetical protein
MAIIYKKLKYPPEISDEVRTDYINKIVTDDSDNVIQQSWIPTESSNADYQEYLEWEAKDGNTIADAD